MFIIRVLRVPGLAGPRSTTTTTRLASALVQLEQHEQKTDVVIEYIPGTLAGGASGTIKFDIQIRHIQSLKLMKVS